MPHLTEETAPGIGAPPNLDEEVLRETEDEEEEVIKQNNRTKETIELPEGQIDKQGTELPMWEAEYPLDPQDHPQREGIDPPGGRLQRFAREWEGAPPALHRIVKKGFLWSWVAKPPPKVKLFF